MADLSYFIVGGGASGAYPPGTRSAGGGGAGRVKSGIVTATISAFTIVVGAAGLGVTTGDGADGGNSTAFGITANGGGKGSASGDGFPGGHGGGASGHTATTSVLGGASNDSGNPGGAGIANSSAGSRAGGGGGGEGGVGGDATTTQGGNGGSGIQSDFDGTLRGFAAGGSGGGTNFSVGGLYGGGSANGVDQNATTPGSGGAGLGRGTALTTSGNGFRGEVMVKYLTGSLTATGGTVTTSGLYTIHTFTADGVFNVTAIASGSTEELRTGVSGGSATVSGQQLAMVRRLGSVVGISNVNGVPRSQVSGTSAGVATTLGVATGASSARVGTSAGSATVQGRTRVASRGISFGQSTAIGLVMLQQARNGTAVGAAAVSGKTQIGVRGTAAGSSTVYGDVPTLTDIYGQASGQATVNGVGIFSRKSYPLATTQNYAPNTFNAALPESIREISPTLFTTLRDMVEKIRSFSSDALAGGLRLPQLALIRRYYDETVPLGSVAAIRLDEGGTAYARFMKFDSLPDDENLGALVYETDSETASESGESFQFAGIDYTREGDGLFGWVVVSGVTVVPPYLWSGPADKLLGINESGVFTEAALNKCAFSLPGGKIRLMGGVTNGQEVPEGYDIDIVALYNQVLDTEEKLSELTQTFKGFLDRVVGFEEFSNIALSRLESRDVSGELNSIRSLMQNYTADTLSNRTLLNLDRTYLDSMTGQLLATATATANSATKALTHAKDSKWWSEVSTENYLLAQVESGISRNYALVSNTASASASDSASEASQSAIVAAGFASDTNANATIAVNAAATSTAKAAEASQSALVAAGFGSGGNLLPNTEFTIGPDNWDYYAPPTTTVAIFRGMIPSTNPDIGVNIPHGMRGLVIISGNQAPANDRSHQWATAGLGVPVIADKWYEASVYVACNNCQVGLRIDWYNSLFAFISNTGIPESTVGLGTYGRNINNYARQFVKGKAPAGAAYAFVVMYKRNTVAPAVESAAIWIRPQLAQVTETHVGPVAYSEGLQTATILTQATALATATERTAAYLQRVSAGSGIASLELRATDINGVAASEINLIASSISIRNPVGGVIVDVAVFSGGKAQIKNALLRNAKVSNSDASQIFHEIEMRPIVLLGGDGATLQYQGGDSYFGTPRIEPDMSGLPALGAGEIYTVSPINVSGSQFTAKVKKIVGGSLANQNANVYGAGQATGSFPSHVMQKPTIPDAYNDQYYFTGNGLGVLYEESYELLGPNSWRYETKFTYSIGVYFVNLQSLTWQLATTISGNFTRVGNATSQAQAQSVGRNQTPFAFARSVIYSGDIGDIGARSFGLHPNTGSITNFANVAYTTQSAATEVAVGTLIPWRVYPPASS